MIDHGQARASDPATSHAAARLIRPGSARSQLLKAHWGRPEGLTDEEAATFAGLRLTSEYATRCSELTRAGLLEDLTDTRAGLSGMARQVRRITPLGIEVLQGAVASGPRAPACPVCHTPLLFVRPTLSPDVVAGRCLKHGQKHARVG